MSRIKGYIILTWVNRELKDPVFAEILNQVADWANRQGLEKKRCSKFSIKPYHDNKDDDDPLNVVSMITCDIEEKEE